MRFDRMTVVIGVVVLGLAGVASAAPVPDANDCQAAIDDATATFFQKKAAALQECEHAKVAGELDAGTVCADDAETARTVQRLADAAAAEIAQACGGRDRRCGTGDDRPLGQTAWAGVSVCPNFESGSCDNAIANCADVATCVTCVAESAVDQAMALFYGALLTSEFGTGSPANECQAAIGEATTKFLVTTSKALEDCKGNKSEQSCAAKAASTIDRAETKKIRAICEACGGPDEACGGDDDLAPEDFGFTSTCPDVTPPGGSSCGGPIATLEDVVACVDCVTQFKVRCVSALASPGIYPPECNAGGTTTTTLATTTTSSTTTSTSTTTTTPPTCGNGVVDPGEDCDLSSPSGALLCPSGTTCTAACTCVSTTTSTTETTTTTTVPTTTSTSTTTTTSTTAPPTCGNGIVDPGEDCDLSSPSGALLCPSGTTCTAACTCVSTTTSTTETTTTTTAPTTTTTTAAPTTTTTTAGPTTTTSTTTTTAAPTTTAPPTTTTSSTTTTTTTTTPTTTTTSTTTTTTSTTTTTTVPNPSFMDFTTLPAGGTCGATFSDTTGTTQIKTLTCGGLNIGGGQSTVPEGPTPDGATSRFSASCVGDICTLGPTSSPGTTFDCTNTGCNFGPPLPVPNGGLSTCIQNTFATPASGTVDRSTGVSSTNVSLSSNVVVTGNNAQPCPICRSGTITGPACAGTPASPCTGVCEGSANQNGPCTSTNSVGLSRDCPQAAGGTCYKGTNNGGACTSNTQCPGGTCAIFVGTLAVDLSPLTTGTATESDASGVFCTGQSSVGCFGSQACRLIRETGAPAGPMALNTPVTTTLATVFCIPASGNILIDGAAALPGPGATSLPGSAVLLP